MSHTLEEAKEMICHLQRQAYDDKCIGDKCMAWRWERKETWHKEQKVIRDERQTPMNKIVWIYVQDTPTHGYCGLVGKPEVTG